MVPSELLLLHFLSSHSKISPKFPVIMLYWSCNRGFKMILIEPEYEREDIDFNIEIKKGDHTVAYEGYFHYKDNGEVDVDTLNFVFYEYFFEEWILIKDNDRYDSLEKFFKNDLLKCLNEKKLDIKITPR